MMPMVRESLVVGLFCQCGRSLLPAPSLVMMPMVRVSLVTNVNAMMTANLRKRDALGLFFQCGRSLLAQRRSLLVQQFQSALASCLLLGPDPGTKILKSQRHSKLTIKVMI